jgi:hypothetical protein
MRVFQESEPDQITQEIQDFYDRAEQGHVLNDHIALEMLNHGVSATPEQDNLTFQTCPPSNDKNLVL